MQCLVNWNDLIGCLMCEALGRSAGSGDLCVAEPYVMVCRPGGANGLAAIYCREHFRAAIADESVVIEPGTVLVFGSEAIYEEFISRMRTLAAINTELFDRLPGGVEFAEIGRLAPGPALDARLAALDSPQPSAER